VNWSSPAEFFAMGGYGLYVWGAYAIALVCLVADPIFAARRHRQALDDEEDA
jgi:heme exporter protein D